jgi:chromosome segregation ATPase
MAMKNWQWWKLYTRVKPLLTQARAEDEMKKMQEDYETTKKELEKLQKRMKEVEEQNVTLTQQKNDMFAQMQAGDTTTAELEEKIALLVNQKGEQEEEIKDLESRIADLEGGSDALTSKLDKKDEEINGLKKNVENLELNLQKVILQELTYCFFLSFHDHAI